MGVEPRVRVLDLSREKVDDSNLVTNMLLLKIML